MFESGFVVCFGLVMWFLRCKWKTRIKLLSYPLVLDIAVFVLLTAIHWGTYTGVMAATIAALMTSLLISIGRKLFGYFANGYYVRGMIDVTEHLD